MTPLERYQQDLLRPDFQPDVAQRLAIDKLQAVFDCLVKEHSALQEKTLLAKAKAVFSGTSKAEPVKGLYFWGGVGRGKTYLMDVFFDCLPFENKMRSHFHRFMQFVHGELKLLEGNKNPLDIVAMRIARQVRVICFDEFFVSDITDAMILGSLFEKLFDMNVVLIATSNIIPDELYKNGLQRQRFLPAIQQIKQHCEILNIDSGVDYRLRVLEQAELYYYPLGANADASLMTCLLGLAPDKLFEHMQVTINNRPLQSRYEADDVVWFDFGELCDGPRSQNDYIELARIYHAIILSNVPLLDATREDQARRFINLVDEFYDRNVKLVISAEVAIKDLYAGSKLRFEFERTQSRLLEMQSREYLATEHRP